MALIVCARLAGSDASREFGRPWPTSQNGQRRVQISPMIMKVAVPLEKHSPRFGQEASSHTVCRLFSRRRAFSCLTRSPVGALARIQAGLRLIEVEGTTLIGIRASLAAPLSLTP